MELFSPFKKKKQSRMITTCLHTGQGSVIVVNHKVYMMMSLNGLLCEFTNLLKWKKTTTSSDSVADR